MGLGIQIKKPEHVASEITAETPSASNASFNLSPVYLLMTGLTFLSAFVALYFFFQTRSV